MNELEHLVNISMLKFSALFFVVFIIPVTILAVAEERARVARWYRMVFPVKEGGSK